MKSTRRALLASLLIALSAVAGQALASIPNVELITFLVFLSGYLLGPRYGAFVGGAAMGAHSLFNVMGSVVPPMLVTQIIAYAAIGAAGGTLGVAISRVPNGVVVSILAGVTGATLALAYQFVINVAAYFTFTSTASLWTFIVGGIAFSAVQIGWNAAVFFAALRPTTAVLSRFRDELNGTA